jgi:tRNA pseudouridine13 synthase
MMDAAATEAAVGMWCYATTGRRCQGRAKSSPEDFRVEEQVNLGTVAPGPDPMLYPLYRVEKRGIDTMHMAREVGAVLKSRVSYGGMKDSRAVAVQYVTPTSLRSERPERFAGDRYTAELMGYLQRPLTRSSVTGNRFNIVLRGCCKEIGAMVSETMDAARAKKIPNYFGLQRFGVEGAGTHLVGKALVKGDFQGAVDLLVGEGGSGTRSSTARLGDVESKVAGAIKSHPREWLRALRVVPVNLRRLYVQAYQSFIFNVSLSRALRQGEDISEYREGDNWAEVYPGGLVTSYPKSAKARPSHDATPLIQLAGYAFRDYGSRFDAFVKETLSVDGVSPRQFFLKEMQEVSAEGGFRRPHLAVAAPSWEANGGTAHLEFSLAKGQYATVLLREALKPEDPAGAGLI